LQKVKQRLGGCVRILGIVVAEAVIIVLIVRKDASYTDQNNDIYDHRA